MEVYDVAVFPRFRAGEMPYSSEIAAVSPLLAVLSLMQLCGLERVEHAGVKLERQTQRGLWVPEEGLERWKMGRGFWVRVS